MTNFDDLFLDTYKPLTHDLLGSGDEWFFFETDNSILKNRREELGLTQQEVANAAHIQIRQYQRLESGERSIRGSSLRIGLSICSALKLDPYRFMPEFVWMKAPANDKT